MPGLIGKKVGMTSVYTEDGRLVPVTAIEAGPCHVIGIRTKEKDGYSAVVIGYGEKKEKHLAKPQKEYYKKHGLTPSSVVKEFRNFDDSENLNIGDAVSVELFSEGDKVKVTGRSKGKGFQGVVKRYNFKGVNDATHGQHNRLRAPGSLGASSYPSRVFKGMRMAGRTGNDRVKMINLKVLKVLSDKNVILVKGSVPGAKGSYLFIEN